jgi:hypothetical protein
LFSPTVANPWTFSDATAAHEKGDEKLAMLDRSLRIAWVMIGIAALLVLAVPHLVVLGFFFLILPGIILVLLPTVFIYLTGTLAVRLLLPIGSAALANLAAFGIVLLLGWGAMQPFRASEVARYESAALPDISPAEPLLLQGNVRLEVAESSGRQKVEPACDHLCIALLDLAGVTSVTLVIGDRGATYQLVAATASPAAGLFPEDPGRILNKLPGAGNFKQRDAAGKALEAHWALRLATNERLVTRPALPPTDADWVLRLTRRSQRDEPQIGRVEIADSTGTCRFRKSYIRHAVPASIFYLGFDGGSSSSGFQGAGFHLGKESLQSGNSMLLSDAEPTLLQATAIRVPETGGEILKRLRSEASTALADPRAAQARLELANRWLALLRFDASASDIALIARIVADSRVHDVTGHLEDVFKKQETPPALRDAYADRIVMEHTSAKDRLFLAERLAAMPPGTFANPSKAHLTIWTDPELRLQAAPLVARLADLGGETAIPLLVNALEAAVPMRPWNAKRVLVAAIRDGFAALGPDAAGAVPRIRELFLQRPSPILHNAQDAENWRVTLLRMGVEMDDLPFFLTQSEQDIRRIKSELRKRLQRDNSQSK